MQLTDVLIHISEPLEINDYQVLETKLRNINGVIAPRFNQKKPNLLFIAYNAEETNSSKLLSHVKAKHLNASLIGM